MSGNTLDSAKVSNTLNSADQKRKERNMKRRIARLRKGVASLVRNPLICAARGCDGCTVCKPKKEKP